MKMIKTRLIMYLIYKVIKLLYNFFLSLIPKKKKQQQQELSHEEAIEAQLEDERLQMVQSSEDSKMKEHIMLQAAKMVKDGLTPEQAMERAKHIEHPEYNIWHQGKAKYKDQPIADHIYELFLSQIKRPSDKPQG